MIINQMSITKKSKSDDDNDGDDDDGDGGDYGDDHHGGALRQPAPPLSAAIQ